MDRQRAADEKLQAEQEKKALKETLVKEFFMDKEKISSRDTTKRNSGLSGIMDAYISGEIQKSAEKDKQNCQILSLMQNQEDTEDNSDVQVNVSDLEKEEAVTESVERSKEEINTITECVNEDDEETVGESKRKASIEIKHRKSIESLVEDRSFDNNGSIGTMKIPENDLQGVKARFEDILALEEKDIGNINSDI